MTDVDGHEYVDYLLGLGPDDPRPPPPRGHQGGARTRSPSSAPASALPYELEIEAAQKVVDAVPSLEMVRFTNSGSEAVGTAVRLARAVTGRRLLVRFEGHYHGWQDVVYWSNHVDPDEAGPADHPRPVRLGPRRAAGARRHARSCSPGTTPRASSASWTSAATRSPR